MIVTCKNCSVTLTNNLIELKDKSLINENDGEDYIPEGFYIIGNEDYHSIMKDRIVINIKDLINSTNHWDRKRLNGCCGLDGTDGINKICINNHEICTEKSDCWMAHFVIFEPDLVETIS